MFKEYQQFYISGINIFHSRRYTQANIYINIHQRHTSTTIRDIHDDQVDKGDILQ